jgi:hypothetical protein
LGARSTRRRLRRLETPFRDPRFDLPALVIGALGTAALSIGLAAALLRASQAGTGSDVGPTAATLGDAFSFIVGASLGMLDGCALAAFFCRRGSRIATGILVGVLGWLVGVVAAVIATRPDDISVGDAFNSALFLGVLLAVLVISGAIIGAGLGATRD